MNSAVAEREEEAAGRPVKHSSAREWYESLLVAGILVLFVRTFVVQTYQVPTGSMEKTILVGDHLLVNKFAYAPRVAGWSKLFPYRDVHRGDIIVFKKPGDDVNPGNVLVKRAVAGPGQTVLVRDKALLVDGKPADGPAVQHSDPEVYPNDPAIPAPGVHATPTFSRPFVRDKKLLQREQKPGTSGALWGVAYVAVGLIWFAMLAALAWGLTRIDSIRSRRRTPPASRREARSPAGGRIRTA